MRHDIDIAGVVLRKGYLTPADLFPDALTRSREFWISACQCTDETVWRLLPGEFKDDPEFLKTIDFKCQHTCEAEDH
jgi:hypothetical protein